MKTFAHLWQYHAEFFLEWKNVSDKGCREKHKHILCWMTFSRKSYRLWDNVEKYG